MLQLVDSCLPAGMETKIQDQLPVNCTLISIQVLESQGFLLGTVRRVMSVIQKLLLSFLESWSAVVMLGDLGKRKKESESFQISSDTKGYI